MYAEVIEARLCRKGEKGPFSDTRLHRRGGLAPFVTHNWTAKTPESISSGDPPRFYEAKMEIEHFLTEVLDLSVFNQEDLVELSNSKIPELSRAARACQKQSNAAR